MPGGKLISMTILQVRRPPKTKRPYTNSARPGIEPSTSGRPTLL